MLDQYATLEGVLKETPTHWASNEAWSDDAVSQVVRSSGDTAVVVGSANLATLAPLMAGLSGVCMLDLEEGQMDMFVSRMHAANAVLRSVEERGCGNLSISGAVGNYLAAFRRLQPYVDRTDDLLVGESHTFDLLRGTEMHYMTSLHGMERLSSMFGRLRLGEFMVDITKPDMAKFVVTPPGSDRVGWVHVSNVAMTEYRHLMRSTRYFEDQDKCAHKVGSSIVDFVGSLRGVDNDTVVTFSNYSNDVIYNRQYPPAVSAVNLGSLSASRLLSIEDKVL